jgi:malonyl-CoA/methylmalonyl-CoA synthetase
MSNPLYDNLFAVHAGSDRPFLILPDGSGITYADFLARAGRLANAVVALGLKPGDRVVLQAEKSPDVLALYAACLRAGLIFLPLNTAYTPREMEYFITDSGAALVVCDVGRAGRLGPIAESLGAQLYTLGSEGPGSLSDLAGTQPDGFDTVSRGSDDLAAFLYTSGTTGRSKGAMLTQGNLLSNAKALNEAWKITRDDVLLHALPVYHAHGLFVAANTTLLAGASMIFLPRFDPDEVLRLLPAATTLMGVPTFYTRLLNDPRFDRDLAAHMRLFISGSAPLLAETHQAFEACTGHRILERYGMTETGINTTNPFDGDRLAGTVGFPLPGVDLKITDPESGAELPRGEIGQIELRGPNVFKGYWQMPEKTAADLREDGFFLTGDLGLVDADGYLHIVGRGKDLIISGGLNIYPKEIEEVLDAQPGVLESAVIGVPHPDFGETPVGVLVAQPGAPPPIPTRSWWRLAKALRGSSIPAGLSSSMNCQETRWAKCKRRTCASVTRGFSPRDPQRSRKTVSPSP